MQRYSKQHMQHMASWIGKDAQRFHDLVQLMLDNEEGVSQRAAWALSHCLDQNPELIEPHIATLVHYLRDNTPHDAIKRNTVRVLQNVELEESLWGEVADICFQYLINPQEAAAVRIFSMTVLWNICQKVPELSNELKLIIEDQWEHGSAGFRSRGKKILRAMEKMDVGGKF